MAREVEWTRFILNTFLEESGINDRADAGDDRAILLKNIMISRCNGMSITAQSIEFHCSEKTISNRIEELKHLYDETQKHCPELPVRNKKSAYEKKHLDV